MGSSFGLDPIRYELGFEAARLSGVPDPRRRDASPGRGQPPQFFWDCASGTSLGCPSFQATYNADEHTHATANFELVEFDIVLIGLTIREQGTTNGVPRITREFLGTELG